MFDWTVLNLQQERSRVGSDRPIRVEGAEGQQRERSDKERATKSRAEDGPSANREDRKVSSHLIQSQEAL